MTPSFLSAPGAVADLARRHDWSSSPLGDPAGWPQPLQTVASLVLHSSAPMYVLWGPRRALVYNDAYLPVLGDKHPRALGRPLDEVWPEIWEYLAPRVARAFAGEAVQEQDVCVTIRRKGFDEQAWFSFSYSLVYQGGEVAGLFCHIAETTDRVRMRQAQEALRTAQEGMQLAMQIGDAGTWDLDMVSERMVWSRSRFELLGHPVPADGQATLAMWHNAMLLEDIPALQAEWNRALAQRDVFRSEHRLRRADGRLVWVAAAGRFFYDDAGEPVRFVGVYFDVTRRKHAEEALRTADRRKDEFLATLAHELRNPLAPIRNGLAILRVPQLEDGTRGRMLGLMERQVQHMVRLVDDLLEVSRITRGKIELRREVVELRQLVRSCVDTAQPALQAAQHAVRVDLPAQPVLVDVDPTRMEQVVDNLLNNACKYTPEGGRVRVALRVEGAEAVLEVQDNGTGIPPEMLGRIFELFTQVDRTLGRSKGGLGIGLALVQQLVRLHGGQVKAESAGIGEGAHFTVRLPLLAAEPRPAPGAPGQAPPAPGQGLRVLVVDDNRDAADSLGLLLQAAGHEVRCAYDGPEALRTAAAFRPQWVLLDIGMPDMSGHEVARALRAAPGGAGMKLVAVTGWGQDDDRRLTRAAGFDTHLVKPVEPAAILDLLQGS